MAIQTDATLPRRLLFSTDRQTPPSDSIFSRAGDCVPCLHSLSVFSENHGSLNLHPFIAKRHLSSEWCQQY